MSACLPRLVLGLGLLTAIVPPPARAQRREVRAQAEGLYAEGVKAFKAGDFATAADRFQAAYNLDPSPVLLYNLARATEKSGDAEAALGHYRAYLTRFPKAEDRAEVERIIEVLGAVVAREKEKGWLIVDEMPEGARLFIDDALAPAPGSDGRWALPPGRHTVRIVDPGGLVQADEVNIAPRSPTALRWAPATPTGKPEPKPGPTPEPPVADDGPSGLRIGAYASLGVGAALVGVGTVFFLQASAAGEDAQSLREELAEQGAQDDLVERYAAAKDDLESKGPLSYIFFGVGAAAVAAGVTLLVLDLGEDGAPEVTVAPLPGGLVLDLRF